jgi:hypothetical protein
MSAELYEDSIELLVPVLEAGEPRNRYPYPSLIDTGRTIRRTFAAIHLENASLRIRIVPELGGRVVSVYDKRFSREVIALEESRLVGEDLALGFAIGPRLTSMAPVALQLDTDSGAVLLAESATYPGVSWHTRFSLVGDESLIEVQTRLLNRTMRPAPGLGLHSTDSEWPFAPGLLIQPLARRSETLNRMGRRFEGNSQLLNPRQVDEWTVHILPAGNLGPGAVAAKGIALEVAATSIRMETSTPRTVTVMLALAGGTVEATVNLYPEKTEELPFGEERPQQVAVLESGVEILRYPAVAAPFPGPPIYAVPEAEGGAADPAVRHLAHLRRAHGAFSESDYATADFELERALLYNAEDHLVWWAKAVAARLAGEPEGPELENAHYLAPLEPLLRAEAFLRQTPSDQHGPNPLIAPLAEHPEELIEVACRYIELGLLQEATRWIGEALRHSDLAMLRYLLAYCFFEGTRMDAEAAAQIVAAGNGIIPPLPWRDVEWEALEALSRRVPDEKLEALLRHRSAIERSPRE